MSLPTGWKLASGVEIFTVIRGVTFRKGDASSDGSPGTIAILRAGNLQNGRIVDDDLIYVDRRFIQSNQILRLGDIVVAMSSGSASVVGKAASVRETTAETSFGAFCAAIRPNDEVIQGWLSHYFRTEAYRKQMSASAAGVNINNLRPSHLEELAIAIPPANEQRRIVAKIEALMARSARAREALDAIPALLDRYRQSVLAAAFRGDLTADWRAQHPDVEPASELLERIREERQSRLRAAKVRRGKRQTDGGLIDLSVEPEICSYDLPKGWALARLADLSWQSSYGISSKCDYDFPGSPVLRIPNVANGQLILDDLKRANQESFKAADSVDLGDLLVVRTNGSRSLIGRGAVIIQLLAEPTYFASYLIRFRLLGGIDMARWLATVWHSPQIRAQVYAHAATSAGQYNISLTELSSFVIPIPPLDELRLICRRAETALASTNSVADYVREGIERAVVLDQSMLAKAFRGELVPQDPNDEPASELLARIKAERTAAGSPLRRRRRGAAPSAVS